MYIRRKKSPNSPRQSIQIVEGYRDERGNVKQRIVRHLGVFVDEIEEAKLVALAEDLILKIKAEREMASAQTSFNLVQVSPKKGRPARKSLADIMPVSDVRLEDIVEDHRVVEGVHDVAGLVYDQMNFDQILPKKRDAQILKDMTLARMVAPNS
jgi:iron uptake system EfeUOB component EfeO/EfeM